MKFKLLNIEKFKNFFDDNKLTTFKDDNMVIVDLDFVSDTIFLDFFSEYIYLNILEEFKLSDETLEFIINDGLYYNIQIESIKVELVRYFENNKELFCEENFITFNINKIFESLENIIENIENIKKEVDIISDIREIFKSSDIYNFFNILHITKEYDNELRIYGTENNFISKNNYSKILKIVIDDFDEMLFVEFIIKVIKPEVVIFDKKTCEYLYDELSLLIENDIKVLIG